MLERRMAYVLVRPTPRHRRLDKMPAIITGVLDESHETETDVG